MIPSTVIHFNDDGTAWHVGPAAGDRLALDRPCDTCGGTGTWRALFADTHGTCPYCDGTGRHTFTVEVEYPDISGRFIEAKDIFRVSVVPGMVLPIYDWCPDEKPADHICHAWKGGQQSDEWWQHRSFDHTDWTERQITLPPDAKPGMWAVKLQVHQ